MWGVTLTDVWQGWNTYNTQLLVTGLSQFGDTLVFIQWHFESFIIGPIKILEVLCHKGDASAVR